MAAAGGSQCGYCTPGFVMSLFAEQYRPDRRAPASRCPWRAICAAAPATGRFATRRSSLGPAPPGPLPRSAGAARAPALEPVSIDGFSRPSRSTSAWRCSAADPAATLVAGCTDLGVESNLRHRRWPHLVSVEAIDELHECSETRDACDDRRRAAARRHRSAAGAARRRRLARVARAVCLAANPQSRDARRQSRDRLAHRRRRAAAAGARRVRARGRREPAGGRCRCRRSSRDTGRRRSLPGEMLVAIEIPRPLPELVRFYKVAKRRLDDISTVAAAMALDRDATGRVRRARFAFGGVAATPVRVARGRARA